MDYEFVTVFGGAGFIGEKGGFIPQYGVAGEKLQGRRVGRFFGLNKHGNEIILTYSFVNAARAIDDNMRILQEGAIMPARQLMQDFANIN